MAIKQTMSFLNYLFEGIYLVEHDRTIVFWNSAAEELTGYTAAEVVGTKCDASILLHVNSQGESMCNIDCPLDVTITRGQPCEKTFFLRHKEGHRISINIRTMPVLDESGQHQMTLAAFNKTGYGTSSSDHIMELARKAFIDSRSGLPNKEYMDNKLRSILAAETFGDSNVVGLFFIQLDNLREINNDYGAAGGDTALRLMGKALSANIQSGDIVGRLDGGLFLMITHLDKKFLMLNWANKLKALLQNSRHPDYDINLKICISGAIVALGEPLDKVYGLLNSELKNCRESSSHVSIRDI